MPKTKILYPLAPFDRKAVDPDYEAEFSAARQFSEFDFLFYDYDEFVATGTIKFQPREFEPGPCIYRGWMLKPSQYETLYNHLNDRGVTLVNGPQEYEHCHLFPRVYSSIRQFTPRTKWFEDPHAIDWSSVNAHFDRFMVKDYVKSVKGSDFPTHFQTPVNEADMQERIREFLDLRGKLFTGGIVIKEFVDLKRYGAATNEYRAFFLGGELVSLCPNSNQPPQSPAVPLDLVNHFDELRSNFYTVDFAELSDGRWMVMEVGDGQVSGLSPGQFVFKYYDEIRRILSIDGH